VTIHIDLKFQFKFEFCIPRKEITAKYLFVQTTLFYYHTVHRSAIYLTSANYLYLVSIT
jgi:hypothetical protein